MPLTYRSISVHSMSQRHKLKAIKNTNNAVKGKHTCHLDALQFRKSELAHADLLGN